EKKLNPRTNYLLLETLPLEKTFTVELYSICDEMRGLYSNNLETEFTTKALGITDFKEINLQYSPNPVSDILTIQSDFAIENLVLFDQNGKQVLTKNVINNDNVKLDLSGMATGVYLLKATVKNQTRVVQIIKK